MQTVRMRVSDLRFDRLNPRLQAFNLADIKTEEGIAALLWEAMDARELAMSMAASGFFPHEPLIVAEEGGQNIVIEGNRRLAALMAILRPEVAAKVGFETAGIDPGIVAGMTKVPVLRGTREETWRFLGFKHVNGPAKWGSYEKAQYIAHVHRSFGQSLDDIARQLGDTHRTVARLYLGLRVLEQAQQEKLFDLGDRFTPRFSFSHLYTGLSYDGIAGFLGIADPDRDDVAPPVPPEKLSELREVCRWMYGSRRDQIPPTIVSQNPDLRRLDSVLKSPVALSALRQRRPLDEAFILTTPASNRLLEALVEAQRQLQLARSLATEGFQGQDTVLSTAQLTKELATDLCEDLKRKQARVGAVAP